MSLLTLIYSHFDNILHCVFYIVFVWKHSLLYLYLVYCLCWFINLFLYCYLTKYLFSCFSPVPFWITHCCMILDHMVFQKTLRKYFLEQMSAPKIQMSSQNYLLTYVKLRKWKLNYIALPVILKTAGRRWKREQELTTSTSVISLQVVTINITY